MSVVRSGSIRCWRFFGDDLHAHGFEPQAEECARLEMQEKNPNVRYHAAFVGLPPSDPFHACGATGGPGGGSYFSPGAHFSRSSTYVANQCRQAQAIGPPSSSLESTDQWSTRPLSTRRIAISDFATERHVSGIDFVKIDTDGSDLEAATSCRDVVRSTNILGFDD